MTAIYTGVLILNKLKKGADTTVLAQIIRLMLFALPVVLTFGMHVVLFIIPGLGYLTLPRLYAWSLVVLIAVFAVRDRRFFRRFGRPAPYLAVFGILVVYSLFSLRKAISFVDSLDAFLYLLAGTAIAAFMTVMIESLRDLRIFMRVIAVCYAVLLVIGVFEIYTGQYLFSPDAKFFDQTSAYGLSYPCTVFYNSNDFASFMVVFAPFVVFAVLDFLRGIKGMLAAFALCALMFVNLLGGRARNSFITALLFLFVLFIIFLVKKAYRRLIPMIVGMAFTLPCAELMLRMTARGAGTILSKISSINTNDHSINERLTITQSGLRMAAAHLFTGVGVGNSVPMLPLYADVRVINLHNVALQILAEYGIILFALYMLVQAFLARDFIKNQAKNQNVRLLCILCFMMIFAFLLEGLQSSDATHILALWMLFGILFATDKLVYARRGAAARASGNGWFQNRFKERR